VSARTIGRAPIGAAAALAATVLLVAACERPPMDSTQVGYRGTGMVQIDNPRIVGPIRAANVAPESLPPVEDDGGPRAGEVYQNVQVLGDLSVAEFGRIMAAMTTWVSPEEGCGYCHDGTDLASDNVYTKVVSRRMIEMNRAINTGWGTHVGDTGVTCYTCHRGKIVPENIWFEAAAPAQPRGPVGYRAGQNTPATTVGLTSLPYDTFSQFLDEPREIRVVSTTALPESFGASIKHTEETYGLMFHMSGALGVNCTYCHNTRSFAAWDQSRPQRSTAWYGIRLVRDINENYLVPLEPVFPANRLGPLGDGPKVNCATCHHGQSKPLGGANMYQHYPELGAPQPPPAPPADAAPGEAAPADATTAPTV